ncbi:MAG: hypothetical protein A2138_11275 [Deltaproteobacteria bacterium RBG_16_71_12]|nr:MAG: hypothetical protein A2138_11275 [Deltaproteobacteria bacterium RBG_16_71_12]
MVPAKASPVVTTTISAARRPISARVQSSQPAASSTGKKAKPHRSDSLPVTTPGQAALSTWSLSTSIAMAKTTQPASTASPGRGGEVGFLRAGTCRW